MPRIAVITVSIVVLVGLLGALIYGMVTHWGQNNKRPSTSSKAVQEICQPTDYKEACLKSLDKIKGDDPKQLVRAAFDSAKTEITLVVNRSVILQELEKDPKTAEAVKDCRELFQDSVDDLQRSFEGLGELDFDQASTVLGNLKSWLSATITYQETCLDGFDNTTGDASEKVRKILQASMQMSSNGLAIVTEMSALLGTLGVSNFNKRRLLADDRYGEDTPNWIENLAKNRRLHSSADAHVVGHADGDNSLLEDDDQDKRRRRLLNSFDEHVLGHDDEYLPRWLDSGRRKLLQASNLAEDLKSKANVVVAQDGSGKYKTIEEGLNAIPKDGKGSFIIYIKEGVYNEYLVLYKWMTNVVFVGDGPTKTRIVNNKNFADGVKTFKTATLSVLGDFFMAKDIGIENSAGAIKHQAVALRVQSDQSIFYNVHMDGYQDTLYAHTYRQFYRDCRVTGTIDFIFGDAAAFFQNCTFVVRKPLDNQRCIVTAQGRMERHQPTGIIIHRSRFEADPEYYPIRKKNTAYLGRPWKEYSKTIIMESYIDDSIAPEGWLPWEGDFALETCYYGEYNNNGPGASMTNRVKWRGIKNIIQARAEKFMPQLLFEGDEWIKASGIPYDPTLAAAAPGPGSSGLDEDPNSPAGAPLPFSTSSGTSSSPTSSSQASSSPKPSENGPVAAPVTSSSQASSSPKSSRKGSVAAPVASAQAPSPIMGDRSPSASPTNLTIGKKKIGPMSMRELERMLMTKADLEGGEGEGEDEKETNDDMSGNVPDGDEPSPAKVSPNASPSQEELSGPSPSPDPTEDLDWLPPGSQGPGEAPAPTPDESEPADKVPPTVSPPSKKSSAIPMYKFELHVILSVMALWAALAM